MTVFSAGGLHVEEAYGNDKNQCGDFTSTWRTYKLETQGTGWPCINNYTVRGIATVSAENVCFVCRACVSAVLVIGH